MKVQNQRLGANFKFKTPKALKNREMFLQVSSRSQSQTKRASQDRLGREILRKRLSENRRPAQSFWKQNYRSNGFTNAFMGLMFEDTSMTKEAIKQIVSQKQRIKMGKP